MTTKLLIVDDNPDVCRLLMHTLEGELYDLKIETNGFDALNTIKSWRPHIVLLDVMLPGEMSGLEVCKKVKHDEELKRIYIALLTAKGQGRDIQAGADAGADTYLIKPFSPMVLKSLLARIAQGINVNLY